MAETLFQKKALAHAATPDQLAGSIQLVKSGFANAVAILGLLVLGALVASIFTTVPISVEGKGVILDRGGVSSIASYAGGQVLDVDVQVGDTVAEGDIVVRLDQASLADDVVLAQAALDGVLGERSQIQAFNVTRKQARDTFSAERRTRLTQTLKEQQELLQTYQNQLAERRRLLSQGVIARTVVINTESQVSSTQSAITATQAALSGLDEQAQLEAIEDAQRILDLDLQVDAAERKLKQLSDQLARQNVIRSPVAGRVVEIRVSEGDVIQTDMTLMTILPTAERHAVNDPSKSRLVGYLFVPAEKGSEVQKNMTVKVYPTTVKRQEFGFIRGSVASVSSLPVSDQEMLRYTRNRALVSSLLNGGVAFQVRVDLPIGDTPSGFRWASSNGPPFLVGHGSEFVADVTVRNVRLISLILPFMEKIFPAPKAT